MQSLGKVRATGKHFTRANSPLPLDLYFYPGGQNDINPYWTLLGEALQNIEPQLKIFWDEIRYLNPACLNITKDRPPLIHIHWVPEYRFLEKKHFQRLNRIQVELLYRREIARFQFMTKMKGLGAKVIWTVHDADTPELHSRPFWTSFFNRWMRRLADAYIFHCPAAQKDFFEKNPPKLSWVIPHASFTGFYGPAIKDRKRARALLEIPQDITVFLILGWMRKSKNLDWLLSTLASFQNQNVRFLIAGLTLEEPRWMNEKLRLDNRFVFLDRFFPDPQIRWLLGASDFLVNAQGRGYISAGIITALSYGLPPIALSWGCAPSLIVHEKNGYIFTRDSLLEVLDEAFNLAQNRDKYEKMQESAKKTMEAFSWDRIAQLTLSAYHSLFEDSEGTTKF